MRYKAHEGRSEEAQATVNKTQVYAKLEGDVYGLTPAQCWKVKRRSESSELKPQWNGGRN